MIFIETSVFTFQIKKLISEESYRKLQQWIIDSPKRGVLIRGSGGCRKIRWVSPGKGKRGGIRVICYWHKKQDRIVLLLAYAKSETGDLTQKQIGLLGELIEKEFRGT